MLFLDYNLDDTQIGIYKFIYLDPDYRPDYRGLYYKETHNGSKENVQFKNSRY